ncbi:MAG: efflux RND transporter periplasmic adaptor subunit [Calditrichae bacterium]|nr:efflux RND transporter periplasmic adaptor subunit [Calditrichia bacterium]NIW78008.1 efflux RND transporter periplasmic adaptor subunit [Calditrichia bacterium]
MRETTLEKFLQKSGIAGFLLLLFILMACEEEITRVETEKIFRDKIVQTVTGNGKIFPVTEVKISARIPGKIMTITVEEGDSVKAGQELVYLEKEQYIAALERANSSRLEAQANLTLTKNELKRTKDLFEKDLSSKAELEIAQAKYDQALSRLQQVEATVKEAQDALERTVLSSSISGIVIRKNKEEGEIALGSQFQEDVILVVAKLAEMEVRAEVNENDIINVTEGDTTLVEIDAFPDTTFKSIVTDISNSAITKSQGTIEEVTNFEVRIRLIEQLPNFRPGMSATADIITDVRENALNVPIQSVTVREREILTRKTGVEESNPNEEDQTLTSKKDLREENDLIEVVFVKRADNTVEMRPVKLGISDPSYYEVISGLQEDEEVVTGPYRVLSRDLEEGDKVRVTRTEQLATEE